ncbi:MAG: hypothetical protein PSN34_12280 [Urechidicola sp.]|nr:hypothetical protein [Urechidicola sp.]
MENNNQKLSKSTQLYYKQLITERFIDNPRMSLLFDNKRKNFKKNVFNLVNYCFTIALKLDGVFIARNKKTIVLFYEKNKFKKTLGDHFNYLKVVKGILLSNILKVLKNEKVVKKHQLKLDNFIYVWFIAQQKGYGGLDGLNEINKMLIKISKTSELPILFETSDNKLLNLYNHVGFKVYKELKGGEKTIYFLSNINSIKQKTSTQHHV